MTLVINYLLATLLTMGPITFKGQTIHTSGNLPEKGTVAPDFNAVKTDLSPLSLKDLKGKYVVLNIFPSIDTGVCAQSVRTFNKKAAALDNTVVVCLSKDLPFALQRFCGAEGIENVLTASLFRCDCFSKNYGVEMVDGPLRGLMARSVVVIDPEGKVVYTQLVPEVTNEPDYDAALAALK